MDKQDHDQITDRIREASAALLCFASGATDVLSYLTLGRVFTSAMTGAAALFFLTLLGGHYPAAIRAAVALVSYMAGSALAALLQPDDQQAPPALRRLLIVEALVLGTYCLVSALGHHPLHGGLRYGLICLSALAMGVQTVIAGNINEPAIPTVVLNLTMTSIMTGLTRLMTGREHHLPHLNKVQIAAVLAYALGAAAAAASLLFHGIDTDLLPLAAVLCVLGLYHYRVRREQG